MIPNASSIKAIIADDESLARNVIRKYLADYPDIEVVAEANDGLTALNLIQEHRPGLVFLDIQMPELDGLSMLNELDTMPMILFTTAYHQYAIQAFDHHAVDYLLKPFDKRRFDLAISRVMDRLGQTSALQVQLKVLQDTLDQLIDGGKKYLNRILVKSREGHVFVETRDILRFEAYSDYVKIHTRERFFLKNISMMELESRLNPDMFVRIHRSAIIQISQVKEMRPHFNGEYIIILSNGDELKLSRSYKDRLKRLMDETL